MGGEHIKIGMTYVHCGLISLLLVAGGVCASISTPAFVGSDKCKTCHQDEYTLWKNSHHDWAMRPATAENVSGDFTDVLFDHYGAKSRFYTQNNKFYVETDDAEGKPHEFEIAYTFGVSPLQQYLINFPDGRMQALSVAWDNRPKSEGGQRWFHLYPDEAIPHDDILHWTGAYQNWNSRCAECHSTNLQRNYNNETNQYNTTWSDINVACEACHGPGEVHVQWSKTQSHGTSGKGLTKDISAVGQWRRSAGDATAMHSVDGQSFDKKSHGNPGIINGQVSVCGSCHSRRTLVGDINQPGNYHNAHSLQLLEQALYYPDGQIQEEVYVLGSFLQSKMYHRGVVCSNCHEPHSLKLEAEGNSVCTQCHSSEIFDSNKHHHHSNGTGSQCVNCHMPETTYMVVDPRRDHSIRIPRPDLSDKLGTPNACNQCHTEKSTSWAVENISGWLSNTGKTLPRHYGETFISAQQGAVASDRQLIQLAKNADTPAIVRGTALSLLQNYPSRETILAAQSQLSDSEPLVRIGAVRVYGLLPPEQRLTELMPLLNDPVKSVRLEVQRLLSNVPTQILNEKQREQLEKGLKEYWEVLQLHIDTPNGQLNLGVFYLAQKELKKAEHAYQNALRLEPKKFSCSFEFG